MKIFKKAILTIVVVSIITISITESYKKDVYAIGTGAVIGGSALADFSALWTALAVGGGITISNLFPTEKIENISTAKVLAYQNAITKGFYDYCSNKYEELGLSPSVGMALADAFVKTAITTTKSEVKDLSKHALELWQEYCQALNHTITSDLTTPADIPHSLNDYFIRTKPFWGHVHTLDYSKVSNGLVGEIYTCCNNGYCRGFERVAINSTYTAYGSYTYSPYSSTMECQHERFNDKGERIVSYYDGCIISVLCYYKDGNNIVSSVVSATYQPCVTSFENMNIYIPTSARFDSTVPKQVNNNYYNWGDYAIDTNLPILECETSDFASSKLLFNYLKNFFLFGIMESVPIGMTDVHSLIGNNDIIDGFRTAQHGDFQDVIEFGKDNIFVRQDSLKDIPEADYPNFGDDIPFVGGSYGSLGWDIPNDDVWQKILDGVISLKDVLDGLGSVAIPTDRPYVDERTGTLVIPKDIPISYPWDRTWDDVIPANPPIDTPIDKPIDNPTDIPTDKPIGGTDIPKIELDIPETEFEVVAFDLSKLFPFCIPFDLIHFFQKLTPKGQGTPPKFEFTFDFKFAEPYTFIIDFEEFKVLSVVLRDMLALLFVFGLIRLTREIIKG